MILIACLTGWLLHEPFIFASLGPTAYELVETPERPSARPYNIVLGHLIGVLAGFLAIFLTHARKAPQVSPSGVPLARVGAAVLAVILTVAFTLLCRATQPAAISTTLLVALGMMQRWQDALVIMASVVLMTVIGEPIRRLRIAGGA